jgi:tRNA pseudouridine55 synthase
MSRRGVLFLPPLDGVLVIDKPGGMSSAHVVARVKRALGVASVGHTGTLDPMATGVLPIVVGEATKIAQFLLADDKSYEGELELGVTTDTLDREGKELSRSDASGITRDQLLAAMTHQTGQIEQVPPMYSALKHEGKRLHELARAGKEVDRAARPVRIDRFELLSFDPPRARFAVDCEKGTYVRSLVRDLGAELGPGATLTELRRTRAGRFTLADAVGLEQVSRDRLIPPATVIDHLPGWPLSQAEAARVAMGQRLAPPSDQPDGAILRLLTPSGRLAAVARIDADRRIAFLRVFAAEGC